MKVLIELSDDLKDHPLGHKILCKIKNDKGHVIAILTWEDVSSMPEEWVNVLKWVEEACEIDYNCGKY